MFKHAGRVRLRALMVCHSLSGVHRRRRRGERAAAADQLTKQASSLVARPPCGVAAAACVTPRSLAAGSLPICIDQARHWEAPESRKPTSDRATRVQPMHDIVSALGPWIQQHQAWTQVNAISASMHPSGTHSPWQPLLQPLLPPIYL